MISVFKFFFESYIVHVESAVVIVKITEFDVMIG